MIVKELWIFCEGLKACPRGHKLVGRTTCLNEIRMGLYFEPFPMSKPSSTSNSPMIINVQTCSICDGLFPFKDICMGSCGHTYRPWCLLVHILLLKKCKVANCDEEFKANWCYSFGLSKLVTNMFGRVKK